MSAVDARCKGSVPNPKVDRLTVSTLETEGEELSASRAGRIGGAFSVPALGAILELVIAALALDERLTLVQAIGGILAMAGVVLVRKR
jgi:uncharacterized membrane protein